MATVFEVVHDTESERTERMKSRVFRDFIVGGFAFALSLGCVTR